MLKIFQICFNICCKKCVFVYFKCSILSNFFIAHFEEIYICNRHVLPSSWKFYKRECNDRSLLLIFLPILLCIFFSFSIINLTKYEAFKMKNAKFSNHLICRHISNYAIKNAHLFILYVSYSQLIHHISECIKKKKKKNS